MPPKGFYGVACGCTDAKEGTELIMAGGTGLGEGKVNRYILDVQPQWEVIGTAVSGPQVIFQNIIVDHSRHWKRFSVLLP